MISQARTSTLGEESRRLIAAVKHMPNGIIRSPAITGFPAMPIRRGLLAILGAAFGWLREPVARPKPQARGVRRREEHWHFRDGSISCLTILPRKR